MPVSRSPCNLLTLMKRRCQESRREFMPDVWRARRRLQFVETDLKTTF